MPRSRGRLPQLGASRPSNLPASPEEHIDIRDLTWDDRERERRAPPRNSPRRAFCTRAHAYMRRGEAPLLFSHGVLRHAPSGVLRLLFAKINNSAPFPQMPPHPLHDDPAPRGADGPTSAEMDMEANGLSSDAAFFVTQPEQA